jgi:hypothetical protein
VQFSLKLITHYSLLVTFAFLTACSGTPPTPTATLVPSLTPSPIPTLQASPTDFVQNLVFVTATSDVLLTPTETPLVLQIEPITGDGIAPPFTIVLPPQWEIFYTNYILSDVTGLLALPLTVYRGPVTGGTGTIAVLWAYPSISAINPLQPDTSQVDLFADGLRLLRLAVMDQGCNIGTDLQRQYTVGGLPATGTQFAAVTCPATPDTRGWFASLQVNELNFAFYMYTDPIEAIDGARAGLQAVLDGVTFLSAGDMQATAISIPTIQATQLIATVIASPTP